MFHNPQSVPAILGTTISFLILDVLTVILRFAARRRTKQQLKIDDWLTLPCLILVFACCSILFYGINTKFLGYRSLTIGLPSPSDFSATDDAVYMSKKLQYVYNCIYIPSLGLVKISILCLYRRLFVVLGGLRDVRNVVIVMMMVLVGLWTIPLTFATIFSCGPHVSIFYAGPPLARKICLGSLGMRYAFAIPDFITDALILLIPIPLVGRLRLPLRQRIAMMGVFIMGSLATAMSLFRLIAAISTAHVNDPAFDPELHITSGFFFGILEIEVGLIAACLPTLRALIQPESVEKAVRNVKSVLWMRSRSRSSSAKLSEGSLSPQSDISVSEKRRDFIGMDQIIMTELEMVESDGYSTV